MSTRPRTKTKQEVVHEQIVKDEKKFQAKLDQFRPYTIQNIIELFIKSYNQERLQLTAKSKGEKGQKQFMILREMEAMYKQEGNPQPFIENCIAILKNKNIKEFAKKNRVQRDKIQQIVKSYGFLLSKEPGVLHKKGKITHKHLIRAANETLQFFGQVKNRNMKYTFKKQEFANFECFLETKNQVHKKVDDQKNLKKKKAGFFKILKWPKGEKKVSGLKYRVRFVQLGSKRQYALYYNSAARAQKIKNNCVFQRYKVDNSRGNAIMKKIKFIWKIKQAEYFYQRRLKSQFLDKGKAKFIMDFNSKVKKGTYDFLKANYPNMYESNYDPHNAINFEDGSHLNVLKTKRRVTMEADPSKFATLVNNQAIFKADEEELEKLRINSPFEDINTDIEVNTMLLKDSIETFEKKPYETQIKNGSIKTLIETLSTNSLMILNFNKIIIDNVFSHEECHLDEKEINQLLLQVKCAIDKGNHSSTSMTFAEEETSEFIAFDIDSSFQVSLTNLQNIKITITNLMNKDVLFDSIVDITPMIDTVSLENYFDYGFRFKYKGLELQGNINFVVVFLPRNLEISHLLLNKDLITLNFKKFQELLTSIQDYPGFLSQFISKQYQVEKRKVQTKDFFYFYNYFLERNFDMVMHQENLLINSTKPENYEETEDLLKKIISNKYNQKELLEQPVDMLKTKAKKKKHPFFDLIVKVISLVSSKERLLFINFLKQFRHSTCVNENIFEQNPGFNNAEIKIIQAETQNYLKKYNFLTDPEQFLAWSMVFKTYLVFENNHTFDKPRTIYFSTHYIPLIIKYTILNMKDTHESDILTIIVNQISAQIYFKDYSIQNNLEHLDRALVFTKLVFKRCFKEDYVKLTDYMISFDDILLKGFMNSYADIFDTINLAVYCDFKNLLFTVFLSQQDRVKVLNFLNQLEISFHVFIDICFGVLSLVNEIDNFKSLEPEVFLDQVRQSFYASQRNFDAIFAKILELINTLIYQDFLYDDFEYLQTAIHPRNRNVSKSFKILQSNIQNLNLTSEQVKKLIDNEVVKDSVFVNRALTLFQNKTQDVQEDSEDVSDEEPEEEFNDALNQDLFEKSMINEDIFFEIACDFDDFEDEMDDLEKKAQQTYKNAILFLNNINVDQVKNSSNTNQDENLHTFRSMNMEQFYRYCQTILKCPDQMKTEIYHNISRLVGKEDISLMNFIIVIICTFTEDQNEIAKVLQYFTLRMSEIYMDDNQGQKFHFNEIVQFVNKEVSQLLPISYHSDFLIKFHNKSDCFVRTARIVLEKGQIDITQLTIKHYIASTIIQGKNSIHFNRSFCKDIECIFSKLMEDEQIEYELRHFEILIDIENQGNPKSLNIPFKIQLLPDVDIFCKFRRPIFFPKDYNINNLVDENVIANIYLDSPLCYNRQISTLKSSMRFMSKRFVFSFMYDKKKFLTLNVNFGKGDKRLCVSQVQWNFAIQKSHSLVEYSSDKIDLEIPYTCFYIPLGELRKYLFGFLLKSLKKNEILKFVQLFNQKSHIQNSKGKDIDEKCLILDLKSYQKVEKKNDDFKISFVFKL